MPASCQCDISCYSYSCTCDSGCYGYAEGCSSYGCPKQGCTCNGVCDGYAGCSCYTGYQRSCQCDNAKFAPDVWLYY